MLFSLLLEEFSLLLEEFSLLLEEFPSYMLFISIAYDFIYHFSIAKRGKGMFFSKNNS